MMNSRRPFKNKLNDLDPKNWIKFQKSWFLHNPPPRSKDVIRHPAKFPESMIQEFIEFFTKRGQVVLDPMAGTGSTLIAALRAGRIGYGIELNQEYAEIARGLLQSERDKLADGNMPPAAVMITGNAANFRAIAEKYYFPEIDYMITSPPYWNMLRARGAETQKKRRGEEILDVYYSEDEQDLGNIDDYQEFLECLVNIYSSIQPHIRKGAYLTIIVKNIKKGGTVYPLAWDLARLLSSVFTLKDERIWVQDNQRLTPYGMGSAWVSNTFHHYCLQFRNE
jgi:DNA modification methylase